jgi:hypothetical protein
MRTRRDVSHKRSFFRFHKYKKLTTKQNDEFDAHDAASGSKKQVFHDEDECPLVAA